MEQRDYLLREIEKIGIILRAILGKLRSSKGNDAIIVSSKFEDLRELVMNDIDLDLEKLLDCDVTELDQYLNINKGFNINNIEILAYILSDQEFNPNSTERSKFLKISLRLLEYCNSKDKTYSQERENRILLIKNALEI